MSTDLTFITNEPGKSLRDRFGVLLGDDTRYFDCLVGYFFISGFHKLHPALTKTEKIRILVGIKADRATYELIQTAKKQAEFVLESHAQVRERVPDEILRELQESGESSEIENGVRKFVEWIKSGKLEVRTYPSERVHAKLYIMTFHEGDRDKGRVITGSSNFTEAGLVDNLEFNVELKIARTTTSPSRSSTSFGTSPWTWPRITSRPSKSNRHSQSSHLTSYT